MSYPPPDRITTELNDDPVCQWDDHCSRVANATRYDDFTRAWLPVCEDHRR